jgi:hypothetical protein
MNECWFCGEVIDRLDTAAILITASGLWVDGEDAAIQELYSHSTCAVNRLKGASEKFKLDHLFDLNLDLNGSPNSN